MTNSSQVSHWSVAFMLAIGLCLLGIGALAWRITSTVPSPASQVGPTDEQLIDNFNHHRSQFNRLAELFLAEERTLTIFPQDSKCRFNDPRSIVNDLGDENCPQYAELFRLLGLEWAFSGRQVFWAKIVTDRPITWDSAYKVYYYLSEPIKPFETMVDNTDTTTEKKSTVCRYLEDNWYICLVQGGGK